MEVKMKPYNALPCALKTFSINGIRADQDDFGIGQDEKREIAGDYGCGYWRFTAKPATQAVLDKYHITIDEYEDIAKQLEVVLDVGPCGWCV